MSEFLHQTKWAWAKREAGLQNQLTQQIHQYTQAEDTAAFPSFVGARQHLDDLLYLLETLSFEVSSAGRWPHSNGWLRSYTLKSLTECLTHSLFTNPLQALSHYAFTPDSVSQGISYVPAAD